MATGQKNRWVLVVTMCLALAALGAGQAGIFDMVAIPGEPVYAPIGPPSASDVAIEGLPIVGRTLTGTYTFTGGTNYSEYRWLSAATAGGAYAPIPGGAGLTTYTVKIGDVGRFIRFEVTPIDQGGSGDPVRSAAVGPAHTASASGVAITGTPRVGHTLTGHYDFAGGSDLSAYRWLRSDSADGEYTAIAGATGESYTLTMDDAGAFIVFEVTPVDENGPGIPATSGPVGPVLVPPSATGVAIAGTPRVGHTLAGVYTFHSHTSGPDASQYRWLRASSDGGPYAAILGATGLSYTLTGQDNNAFIRFEVTPIDENGPGAAATSAPVGRVYVPGDFNGDGAISGLDIPGFKQALADPDGWALANPDRPHPAVLGDFSGDSAFSGLDIPGFKQALAGAEIVPMTWVTITDNPGFGGQMSRYETTNYQFAQYLNAALTSGDIVVDGNLVKGASGSNPGTDYVGQPYYQIDGPGYTGYGTTNGDKSRIVFSDGSFSVESGFENHPVTYVSWYGAMAFASYYGWRLPTENEWQAVASFNDAYTYGSGNNLYDDEKFLANYQANGFDGTAPNNLPYHPYLQHGTTPVGYFGTFGYGVADMSGNVYEWTSTVSGNSRVICGGAWTSPISRCTISYRTYQNMGFMSHGYGFRVCRGETVPAISMTWATIEGNPGFSGQMSRYETTNAQFAQYLNAALASGDIVVDGNLVKGASGSNPGTDYVGQNYYRLDGPGETRGGAINGSKSRIVFSGGSFNVEAGFGSHPVSYVSWYGAMAFASYYGWRLPTSDEWVAVASFNSAYTYGCGNALYDSMKFLANYGANGSNDIAPNNLPYHPYVQHGSTPVGHFGTFGYGMADMAGNVWEWTSTVWEIDRREVRGGSWYNSAKNSTVNIQGGGERDSMSARTGFRVCRGETVPAISMTWATIEDNPGFSGQMSRYETTNYQFAQYLNAALLTGDVVVDGNMVMGASGSNPGVDYPGQPYYRLDGPGYTDAGAINGSKSRIVFSGGSFNVEAGFGNHPVSYVSWYGATAFARYYGWRLPTENEWVAVASFNGAYTYGSGNALYDSVKFLANYRANGDNSVAPNNLPYHPYVQHGTTPVGHFGTFGYGMADMAGNVWEWTSTVEGNSRIVRGGTWRLNAGSSAVSHRATNNPSSVYGSHGFRVCR